MYAADGRAGVAGKTDTGGDYAAVADARRHVAGGGVQGCNFIIATIIFSISI
jgi:hypothetical protein